MFPYILMPMNIFLFKFQKGIDFEIHFHYLVFGGVDN